MRPKSKVIRNDGRSRRRTHNPFFISHFPFFIAAALLLASCSKDEPRGNEGDDKSEIRFEIGFSQQGWTVYSTDTPGTAGMEVSGQQAPQTRAATDNLFNTAWEDGDQIGLFAVSRASGATGSLQASGNYIHNVKLTYRSANGGTWTPSEDLYFDGANVLDFYAYYPYDASATDPTAIAFNVQADQSGTTGGKSHYNLSDLLTAKADNGGNGYGKADFQNTSIPLTFSHALSLVQVEVPLEGKGFGPSENLVVKLRGVKAGATLDLSAASGVSLSTTGNTQNITMHRVEEATNTTSYTYRALVPAQTVAQDASLFWFEHEDRQLISSNALPAALNMTAGNAERHEIPLPQAVHTVPIPVGAFVMGSSNGNNYPTYTSGDPDLNTTPAEPNRWPTEVQHKVTLTQDFYMTRYEITNAQYAAFLNAKRVRGKTLTSPSNGDMTGGECTWGNNDGRHLVYEGTSDRQWGVKWENNEWVPQEGYANHPVTWVTWYGAYEYAAWVGGSLPTEAQWEYACRGGTTWAYSFGESTSQLSDYAWYDNNSSDCTHEVGLKKTNPYGLYDMHGNVHEWCSDWYGAGYYSNSPSHDPSGPESGSERVARGGSWNSSTQFCRSAYRNNRRPVIVAAVYGFRVVFQSLNKEE